MMCERSTSHVKLLHDMMCKRSTSHAKSLRDGMYVGNASAGCISISINLPGLRHEVFFEFGDGILVGHSGYVITDDTSLIFTLTKHI